jgi:predicted DNA-binding protein
MQRVQLGIRIPASLREKLENYVAETGSSKTEVVTSAIAQYLNCVEELSLSQRMAEFEKRLATLETRGVTK